MKKILLTLLVIGIFTTQQAKSQQVIYPDSKSNQYMTFTFWQWTAYSDYAGYYFIVDNYTNMEFDMLITSDLFSEVVHVVPSNQGTNEFRVGYQAPFVNDLKIKAIVLSPFHSTLMVRTKATY